MNLYENLQPNYHTLGYFVCQEENKIIKKIDHRKIQEIGNVQKLI